MGSVGLRRGYCYSFGMVVAATGEPRRGGGRRRGFSDTEASLAGESSLTSSHFSGPSIQASSAIIFRQKGINRVVSNGEAVGD